MLHRNEWSGVGPRWGRPYLPLKASRKGWVYFAQEIDGGPVKIGSTKNVAARLRQLNRREGHRLRLLAVAWGGKHLELEYHFVLDPWRLRGEWFSEDAPPLAELIAHVDAGTESG